MRRRHPYIGSLLTLAYSCVNMHVVVACSHGQPVFKYSVCERWSTFDCHSCGHSASYSTWIHRYRLQVEYLAEWPQSKVLQRSQTLYLKTGWPCELIDVVSCRLAAMRMTFELLKTCWIYISEVGLIYLSRYL